MSVLKAYKSLKLSFCHQSNAPKKGRIMTKLILQFWVGTVALSNLFLALIVLKLIQELHQDMCMVKMKFVYHMWENEPFSIIAVKP